MSVVDAEELRTKVKEMYRSVAEEPHGTFHFEMGRQLALRLGYPAAQPRARRGDRVIRRGGLPPGAGHPRSR